MVNFFKRSKESSNDSSRSGKDTIDPFQRQLGTFQPAPQEKKRPSIQTVTVSQIENEVNDELKAFQSYVKRIKEISLKIEELTKLFKSGEIPENAYRLILGELSSQLSLSVEDIFRSREVLELARARSKLEWAREKIGLKETEILIDQESLNRDPEMRRMYLGLSKWEEIISKIDSTLSFLAIEDEASVIEQYLSLVKERFSQQIELEEIERVVAMCQQRLNLISEKWSSSRRSKIEQIMNLELKASQIKEDIKESEVRFGVGELDQTNYEYNMSNLQASLKKVEKEISDIRSYMDNMDMKIFRSSELLR